jgi:hypothetical protein
VKSIQPWRARSKEGRPRRRNSPSAQTPLERHRDVPATALDSSAPHDRATRLNRCARTRASAPTCWETNAGAEAKPHSSPFRSCCAADKGHICGDTSFPTSGADGGHTYGLPQGRATAKTPTNSDHGAAPCTGTTTLRGSLWSDAAPAITIEDGKVL